MEEAMVTGAVGKMDDKFKNARTYDLANETNPLLVAGGEQEKEGGRKIVSKFDFFFF